MGVEYDSLVIVGFEFKDAGEYEQFCQSNSIDPDDEKFFGYEVYSGALNLWCGDDYVLGGGENWAIKINQPKIDSCKPDEILMVEAWDGS
jgi:hypothetical protein